MKRIHTTAALFAACSVVAAACSGYTDDEPESGSTGGADGVDIELVNDTDPATEDVEQLDWALFEEPNSMDPDRASGSDAGAVIANMCERLYLQEPDLSITPWLAEDVAQPDERTFVYTLRDGVRFHTGREMTAEDVVASLQHHSRPEGGESDEFAGVESIEQTGEMEVTITLQDSDPQFAYRMAGDAGVILDMTAVREQGQDYGTAGSQDACSGPFQLAEWAAGSHITLSRFEDYWNGEARARAGKITFTWGDESTVANNLRTGTVDGAYLSEPTLAPTLSEVSGLSLYYGPSTGAEKLIPTDRGGGTDPRIRKALSLAINREGIVEAGFQGIGQPWSVPVGPGTWGYERALFEQAHADVESAPAVPTEDDLDEARALVEEAGIPEQPLVIASDGSQLRNVIANAVRSAGQEIDVPVEIKTYSDAGYGELFSSAEPRAEVDFVSDDWYLSKPEPLGLYDNMLPGESSNYLDYTNDEYVQLYEQAARTYDDAERAELVLQLQEMAMDDMLWIPLASAPNTLVLNSDLTGAPVSIAYRIYPWAAGIGRAS